MVNKIKKETYLKLFYILSNIILFVIFLMDYISYKDTQNLPFFIIFFILIQIPIINKLKYKYYILRGLLIIISTVSIIAFFRFITCSGFLCGASEIVILFFTIPLIIYYFIIILLSPNK